MNRKLWANRYKPACGVIAISLFIAVASAQPICPPDTQSRVQLLGDSWTHIMWNNRTYKDVFDQFGFADVIERGNNTAIGGTTASYWALPQNLSVITSELQQNPSIDMVLVSIGGNDMLAGINGAIPGWHTGLNATDEALLFDRIEADIQTMVNGIKSVRPDIRIVFSGYDYLNLLETVANDLLGPTGLLWLNLGQPNPLQINTALSKLEQRKINMANADSRVDYVHALGLMQFVYGYPGFFPSYSVPAPGQAPPSFSPFPGGDPNYATPPVALAVGGTDAIHLNDAGYKHLVVNQMSSYFLNKFRDAPNATFTSEGGAYDGWVRTDGNLGTGSIRVGDDGSSNLYRGIISFNTASIPDNATLTGASLFINRSSLSGINPFVSGSLGAPYVDVKTGSFGSAGIEVGDYLFAADAIDAGCFIGNAPDNGYTIRIDLKPDGYSKINKAGRTQFRIYFQNASGLLNDYVQFHNGNQPGLLAPYLDVFFTVPPPPATATISGSAMICPGQSTHVNVSLTGTAPWSMTWSDGVTENNLQSASHSRIVLPLATTSYQVVAVSDVNGPGSATGSAEVVVLPGAPVNVTGLTSNYCANSPVATLFASPPGGLWTGPGLSGNTFNPALAVLQSGGGVHTLNYGGNYNGCNYSEDFSVVVDSGACSQAGSCDFSPVEGIIQCIGAGPFSKTYQSSGRLWVFERLIPGRTYIASTCDSCGYDSHLMVRDESDSSFMVENDNACGMYSTVTFVAPASGLVGINLTGEHTYNCNPYTCNPHDCNPYNCNPHDCNPYQCNCQTCYQTCYQDQQVYMTCYPGGVQVINGILTSDCIGACTLGFCWRIQYQVPYDCSPYQCNCQTCYQTCFDTCYETCYDTCYQTCTDICGSENFISCTVELECVDCYIPAAAISVSSNNVCAGDSVSFSASVPGMNCNTGYSWHFGSDGIPITSTDLNPQGVTWLSEGTKLIQFRVTEPGFGSDTLTLAVNYSGNSQEIGLHSGWNMISSYVNPANNGLEIVLNDIAADVILVKDNQGQAYIPALSINTIGYWDVTQGYKIKTSDSTILIIGCMVVDPTTMPIELTAGWNMIAYLRDALMDAGSALANIDNCLLLVKNVGGASFIPSFGINTIGDMEPGQGYKVKMSCTDTLYYPANAKSSLTSIYREPQKPVHFALLKNTGHNATIIIPRGSVDGLEKGDEIGVFGKNSKLVGAAVYEGENLAITVWGDDPTTDTADGLSTDEAFTFKVWQAKTRKVFAAEVAYERGDNTYQDDGVAILKKITVRELQQYPAIKIYPNPTGGIFTIDYYLPENNAFHLALFDVYGKQLWRRQVLTDNSTGQQTIILDLSGFPAGLYLCEFKSGSINMTLKVMRY